MKLPSNASKKRSGTRAEFARQADKPEKAAKAMLARHREEDEKAMEPTIRQKEVKRVERLQKDAAQLQRWLAKNPEDRRRAKRGNRKASIRKSNRTDNDSAKPVLSLSKGWPPAKASSKATPGWRRSMPSTRFNRQCAGARHRLRTRGADASR